MKQLYLLNALIAMILFFPQDAVPSEISNDKKTNNKNTIEMMEFVADWQIANQHNVKSHDLRWTNATLYIGMMELSKLSKNGKYRQWLIDIGYRNNWQPHNRMYNADDLAVCQMYLDMFRVEGDKRMFDPTQARLEWMINHPSISNFKHSSDYLTSERWTWCDALFMAPPVFVQMYNITKDTRYLDYLDREYHMTYDLLYDKNEHLFYRDHRYFDKREANGNKVFWSRGNGWVLGGLVKILKELPKHAYIRDFYENLFVEMCTRVAALQGNEGYWHASLLAPELYPHPETSGTGFYVYALAYGINSGLLEREKFLPVVEKGWKALQNAVFPDGKLGWVQPVGVDPQITEKEMTDVYGVGAFLLAGSEIYSMTEKK
jgi:unsaturated rhamnogalacturonyl hydrolase